MIEASWDEFDLRAAEWRVSAKRMKMDSPHIVPLSKQAPDVVRCLYEIRGIRRLLFPGERGWMSMKSSIASTAPPNCGTGGGIGDVALATKHGQRVVAVSPKNEAGVQPATNRATERPGDRATERLSDRKLKAEVQPGAVR